MLLKEKKLELWRAVDFFVIYVGVFFIYNTIKYLQHDFSPELIYYGQILFMPFIGVMANLVALIFIYLVSKKIPLIKKEVMYTFFLILFNVNILTAYINNHREIYKTLKEFITINSTTLYTVYLFLVYFLWAIGDAPKNKYVELVFLLILFLIPITLVFTLHLYTHLPFSYFSW